MWTRSTAQGIDIDARNIHHLLFENTGNLIHITQQTVLAAKEYFLRQLSKGMVIGSSPEEKRLTKKIHKIFC